MAVSSSAKHHGPLAEIQSVYKVKKETMRPKVLVGCECSGVVRNAFIKYGCDAVSCDFLPTRLPGPHIQDNVMNHLDKGWDLLIVHPDCTYVCGSGIHWNSRLEGRLTNREGKTQRALVFIQKLLNAPIHRIVLENPSGLIGTNVRPADQFIQPYQFGDDASKKTGLWLKNLPLLKPTKYIKPRMVLDRGKLRPRWSNQTDSGQNKLGPSKDRWLLRAETYPGIAEAMAQQYGTILKILSSFSGG